MSTGGKIVITVGIASSALLAAWLLTGNRKERTKEFVSKKAEGIRETMKSEKTPVAEEQEEVYYI